jgi:hypothetical protein
MTMDRTSRTDRVLAGLIVELADTRTPDYLEAAIERASSRPQRPTWTFPGRWFPMAETVSRPALLPRLPWRTIGVALVLVALLVVAAILYVGSRPTKVPPPFGVARNGLIAYAADGDIYTADPVTGTATAIVTGPRIDRSPIFSHDGTHVAFLRESGTISAGPFELAVVDRDGGVRS